MLQYKSTSFKNVLLLDTSNHLHKINVKNTYHFKGISQVNCLQQQVHKYKNLTSILLLYAPQVSLLLANSNNTNTTSLLAKSKVVQSLNNTVGGLWWVIKQWFTKLIKLHRFREIIRKIIQTNIFCLLGAQFFVQFCVHFLEPQLHM